MPSQSEEPAREDRSEQLSPERIDQSQLDTLVHHLEWTSAKLSGARSGLTTDAYEQFMPKQTVSRLLAALERLQMEVQYTQRFLLARSVLSSSSTLELPESFMPPHTATAEDYEC